ncbi:hypothetical protein HKI87_07g47360 [Chloropicon roscoffensis]|uniref:Uncharacterized protein n=1 Tax=Chloropicon roscoffensis TaxID=1461544 RepID=A0AAX4PAS1_9CHLO|mmetsp:Transcript_5599/g.20173  ORF Transcript_5599/g.20173 Transcript_5599/m.20173 type:complete len:191 (+) Transcript_5599:119-691(+)
MANVCGGRCGSGCSTSLRPSPRAVATARAGRTAFRLQAKRDDGEEDPLRERIYLEEGNRGRVSKPEPLPVTPSSAYLQRSRGVWQDSASPSGPSEFRAGDPSSGLELLMSGFDDKLDDVETEPPKVAEAFNDAISSEAGKNVRRGMVQAAKLTVDAGVVVAKGAAKGAVPVVSWVVKEGTKAMINKKKKK